MSGFVWMRLVAALVLAYEIAKLSSPHWLIALTAVVVYGASYIVQIDRERGGRK